MDDRLHDAAGEADQHDEVSLFAPAPLEGEQEDGARNEFRKFSPLLPSIVGLAFGRAGLIVASYGSYTSTDAGMLTDGAMLVALAFLGVFFLYIAITKRRVKKSFTNALVHVCIFFEAVGLAALGAFEMFGVQSWEAHFAMSTLCTLASSGAIFYWLLRARGAATITAAVYVFAALILSEIEIYLCTLMPIALGNLVACALALAQYPCIRRARKQALAHDIRSITLPSDYFGFAKSMLTSKRFLIATAIGVGCLAVVDGMLRGYPNGQPISFTPVTRFIEFLVVVGISGTIVFLVAKRHQRIMTVGIFVLMELLACLALICYAAFPDALDIGAIFTTTLNALMVAFSWYIIIAFMSCGWRDPYYYAIAGWMVCWGCRAVTRVALIEFYELSANDMLMCAVMGTAIVLSTQVVLTQFLSVAQLENEKEDKRKEKQQSVLSKIMGLDEHETLADMRQAFMQHNAEEIGKQFMLSEREVEVLALYALGFTQKRVAEELFISPGTTHAHIKRIYAKTGLHSRQEILDYMQHYTS